MSLWSSYTFRSLDKILELQPSVIYPGHGPVILDPVPKIKYYIEHRMARERQILDCVQSHGSAGAASMDIVRTVYKDTPEKLWKAAQVNVEHHLQKLVEDRKVQRTENVWSCFR